MTAPTTTNVFQGITDLLAKVWEATQTDAANLKTEIVGDFDDLRYMIEEHDAAKTTPPAATVTGSGGTSTVYQETSADGTSSITGAGGTSTVTGGTSTVTGGTSTVTGTSGNDTSTGYPGATSTISGVGQVS
jgi:hypothetical protein